MAFQMNAHDALMTAFHAANPGITARAFGRNGGVSYQRLAAAVGGARNILEVGCGDGHLLRLLGEQRTIGLDPSAAELALARRGSPTAALVRGRAPALPFADRAFDGVVSHLVLDVCGNADHVVREMLRVTKRDGVIAAITGGGPTAQSQGIFDAYSMLAPRGLMTMGNWRVRDEKQWKQWIPTATVERIEVDLSGSFDDVWTTLSSGYELHDRAAEAAQIRAKLLAQFGPTPQLSVVFFLAVARI